jgi:hypothetical protein
MDSQSAIPLFIYHFLISLFLHFATVVGHSRFHNSFQHQPPPHPHHYRHHHPVASSFSTWIVLEIAKILLILVGGSDILVPISVRSKNR